MDQQKIGRFLRELRNEKGVTQEQLAELLGVSNRSISRWENGVNMPDFDLLIAMANYFDVGIDEILDGIRKNTKENERMNDMDKKTEETLWKVADYHNDEKLMLARRIHYLFIIAIMAFIGYMLIDLQDLATTSPYEEIASVLLGFVFGMVLIGAVFTSRYQAKIRALKKRFLQR